MGLFFSDEKREYEPSSFKLIKFLKHPFNYLKENKDSSDEAINVGTFIIRIAIIISTFIGMLLNWGTSLLWAQFIICIIFLLLARILVSIYAWLWGGILNLFAILILKKNDSLAAERIVIYASLFSGIAFAFKDISSMINLIGGILNLIVIWIGLSKQYKVSLGKALLVLIIPVIIVVIVAGIIISAFGIL